MMVRLKFKLLLGFFGLITVIILSCSSPTEAFESFDDVILEPGFIYKVTFESSIDSFPNGTVFKDINELVFSPLGNMYRKSIIIKADDLRAKVTPNWRRFIYWAQKQSYSVSLGLICNSLVSAPEKDLNFLKSLNYWKNEIWLHGWDHELTQDLAEFEGRSFSSQKLHLSSSLLWAKQKLGIDLKTFGPPGNRSDELTFAALEANPQLEVWFHSDTLFDRPSVLSVDWVAESSTGQLRLFDDFIKKVGRYSDQKVIVLQIHPAEWGTNDYQKFKEMVDYTLNFMGRRLMTPYGEYTWRQDMSKLTVSKIANTEYRIDCSSMSYPHRLDTIYEPMDIEKVDYIKVLDE